MAPFRRLLPLFALLLPGSGGAVAAGISEKDYFAELPEVLTVTRLAQPISETPGAVTIIDRETIRRSGARELADVLRLVPGYLVGGWSGANPGAAYHVPLDDYGVRNLVLVDGRSTYSSFSYGDTHHGLMTVPLADIERIEVLRGSNSAAYGANAMFGVINIVTRHTQDTRGVELEAAVGEGGIRDNRARLGWGDERASFRLTMERREDSGYARAYDDKIVSQLHFRGDLRPAPDQEWFFAAGVSSHSAGDGFPGYLNNGNPERTTGWDNLYLHTRWERQLSPTSRIKLAAYYDEESAVDNSPYRLSLAPPAVLQTLNVDFGGRARRWNIEFQHQSSPADGWRAVWGGGYKKEEASSRALYYDRETVTTDEKRLFGTLEWRPHARWLVNAGLFVGDHGAKGSYAMPRLMASFHVREGHTLRAGWTKSARLPNLFELYADRRYDTALGQFRYDAATGGVDAEILKTGELGYFGNFRDWRMTLDVRVYRERMFGVIDKENYWLSGYTVRKVADFVNARDLDTRGVEWQLRWKPWAGTEIWLAQNLQDFEWDDPLRTSNRPPRHATTLAWFQRLPGDFDLGVVHSATGAMTWRDVERQLEASRRTDIRLARKFRIGATRAEAALAIQSAGGDYVAAYPEKDHPSFIQERRAYGTLTLEF